MHQLTESLPQASLHPERSSPGPSRRSWATRSAASWTRTNLRMRRRNCTARAAAGATEPWTRRRIQTEGQQAEEEAGSPTGTKLRSTSNRLEPIVIFTGEWTSESDHESSKFCAQSKHQQCGTNLQTGVWVQTHLNWCQTDLHSGTDHSSTCKKCVFVTGVVHPDCVWWWLSLMFVFNFTN